MDEMVRFREPIARREAQELSLLFDISRGLERNRDLGELVRPMLKELAERFALHRGTLTLLDWESGEINIEVAPGLSEKERDLGRFAVGEGVTGGIIASGEPLVIRHILDDPRFLNRTGAREWLDGFDEAQTRELAFLGQPIRLDERVIGCLSAFKVAAEGEPLDQDARLLSIVATLIAHAVRIRQAALVEERRLVAENARLQQELRDRFRPEHIIGNSKAMRRVFRLMSQVASSASGVLLTGESGTGKELVASAIHYASRRADEAFVKLNCAALPHSVIESELFGHEKGSFTGATARRMGRFELADGGTLFLDEIGEMSPAMQVKLLRVLQEGEFERVGGTKTLRTDVRVIAATNQDLQARIAQGLFREDLYYRLQVFPIHLPALRERRTDILQLTDFFIGRFNKKHERAVKRISTPAIDMLLAYHWPGNVRELENCIDRAILLSDNDVIHGHHLPPTLQTPSSSGTQLQGTLAEAVARLEKEMISDALKESSGNRARAARTLGVSERVMGLRVERYGIDLTRFKRPAK